MKLASVVVLLAVAAAAAAAGASDLCSCSMPESVGEGFETETTPVYKATAVGSLHVPGDAYSWTVFEWKVVFRGCAPTGTTFIVKSPKSAAGCGLGCTVNETYLVTVRKAGSATPPPGVAAYGLDVYSAVSCNFNKRWNDVPYEDQVSLFYSEVRGCYAE